MEMLLGIPLSINFPSLEKLEMPRYISMYKTYDGPYLFFNFKMPFLANTFFSTLRRIYENHEKASSISSSSFHSRVEPFTFPRYTSSLNALIATPTLLSPSSLELAQIHFSSKRHLYHSPVGYTLMILSLE